MLKKVLFAIAPMILVATSVMADDSLLNDVAKMDLSAISDAQIEIEDFDLNSVDVDALAGEANGESEDAIEACFRRFGYGCGWNYYGCYRPHFYSYSYCHPSFYCYRPVYYYTYCTPVIYRYYWGCY